MERVRIGIVGVGLIGRRHLRILERMHDVEVAGLVDPAPEAQVLAQDGGFAMFPDVEALLDQGRCDGVVVAVPNRLHAAVALSCIDRGVPALVEKPIADTLSDALAIADAAERRRVPVLVGHHRRHNPILRTAAEALGDGAVGRIMAVSCLWLLRKPAPYFEAAWRQEKGAGPVLVNAIHEIDALRMMCGEIETVQAAAAANAREGGEVEDTAAATLRFASGALGTLVLSDAVPSPYSWEWTSAENADYPHEPGVSCVVGGTSGTLCIPSLELWTQGEDEGWMDPLRRERLRARPAESYVAQLEHFADVARGRAAPAVTAMDGTRTLAATLAVLASAESGAAVRVDDLLAAAREIGPAAAQ